MKNKKRSLFLLFLFSFVIDMAFYANPNKKANFEIGEKTFLLNGKPFVIKAAELHYTRIPYQYWDQRIKMCKALGMNTICMYVFWNIHEPEENHFDFSAQNDLLAFCRLVQKNGMYVILRPGPYVCAEWEMGGLPWWLLKKKNIKLRDNDPYFLERTKIFMNKLGEKLKNMQITRGGNIIMVQVENEYGSYGINKAYVENIRNIVKESGFTDVPLFQCDWSSNFKNNGLSDLLWTMNFGTGANIEKQFAELKQLRPNTPLMCSEFWSGWFDHWGSKHETRSGTDLVEGIKEMLDKNISFSLYMTHGGTSFGHWAGANYPNFSPTCTSYDYDAPIDEAGRTTAKYFELRNLLKKYLPKGEKLLAIPDSIPTISIPEIRIREIAPVFQNLPSAVFSDSIQPMEFFNQAWGSILYRTELHASDKSNELVVYDPHDFAFVFVNGRRIGTLDRMKGQRTINLPPVKEGDVLDIFVEAMGRMNFGKGIYDWKGITDSVTVKEIAGNGQSKTKNLKNWNVYSIPANYDFSKTMHFKGTDNYKSEQPAYFRGYFELNKTGDTYINMSDWGKGMVWVNGHGLGRFWHIGPQQTLFLPGCWLKKGKNEIVILDVDPLETLKTEGLRHPILNKLQGNYIITNRKEGENLDLSKKTPVYKGTFGNSNDPQEIHFGKILKGRYFCLESLNTWSGDKYASIAEFELLGKDGKPLPRNQWKVLYADSEETENANHLATNIFDQQESTYWHTAYGEKSPSNPHEVVVDLQETVEISGFIYTPRPEKNASGMIKDYAFYFDENPFKF